MSLTFTFPLFHQPAPCLFALALKAVLTSASVELTQQQRLTHFSWTFRNLKVSISENLNTYLFFIIFLLNFTEY